MSKPWHAMEVDEVLRELGVSPSGLSSVEAVRRLKRYGPNEYGRMRRRGALHIFLEEFKNILILLLIVTIVFSAVIGYHKTLQGESFLEAYADSIAMSAIITLTVITSFVQKYRAERAIEAIGMLVTSKARVIRDGKEVIIPAREVVPGDILVLREGDRVPADARLIEVTNLRVNEATLTGKSTPVEKELVVLKEDAPISERRNMVFAATYIVHGRGKAVVIATGTNTEFGRKAKLDQAAEKEETPLRKRLNKFANKISKTVMIVCAVIFALKTLKMIVACFEIERIIHAAMSSISLAISAIPEDLLSIPTIALALGAGEFMRRNVVVRRLPAAENLGLVTAICLKKTGIITKSEMTVHKIYVAGKHIEVTGFGYEPKGEFRTDNKTIKPEGSLELLLRIGALCNNASLKINEQNNGWEVSGDPTEGALLVAAAKAGLIKEDLERKYPRINEIPFTPERKYMITIHRTPEGEIHAYMKGAPEIVLKRCTRIFDGRKEKRLTEKQKKEIILVSEQMAKNGLKVLAMAYRRLPADMEERAVEDVENGMVFVGLQGMIDPVREEVIEANKRCREAGIKTIMITGDHKLTAIAIAKEIGIYEEGDVVLTGDELDKMTDEEFENIVEKVTVYARISPEHKLRIIKALKKKGHMVAMIGNNVDDISALKAADIGIAVGIRDMDVIGEAADIILVDNSFAEIVEAVEKGRAIYNNIRKYLRFLISCNFDELLVEGVLALLGVIYSPQLFPLPLLPAMILWINLVTDGVPAIALIMDPPDVDVMNRSPHKYDEEILRGMRAFIMTSFALQTTGTLVVFCLKYYVWPPRPWILPNGAIDEAARQLAYQEASTAAFLQIALFELFFAWNCRSERRSVWRMGRKAFKNKFFVISDLTSIALTLGIIYIPLTERLFHLTALSPTDLALVFGVASWGLLILPEAFMGRKFCEEHNEAHIAFPLGTKK